MRSTCPHTQRWWGKAQATLATPHFDRQELARHSECEARRAGEQLAPRPPQNQLPHTHTIALYGCTSVGLSSRHHASAQPVGKRGAVVRRGGPGAWSLDEKGQTRRNRTVIRLEPQRTFCSPIPLRAAAQSVPHDSIGASELPRGPPLPPRESPNAWSSNDRVVRARTSLACGLQNHLSRSQVTPPRGRAPVAVNHTCAVYYTGSCHAHACPFISIFIRPTQRLQTQNNRGCCAGTTPHDVSEFLDPTATPSMWIGRIILEPVRSAGGVRRNWKERVSLAKKETPGARKTQKRNPRGAQPCGARDRLLCYCEAPQQNRRWMRRWMRVRRR